MRQFNPSGAAMGTMAETAMAYAARGLHVFPIGADTKGRDATGKSTHRLTNGHNGASCDPNVVREWWARWPDANIGLNLAASGLVALDPDLYKAECAWNAFTADKDIPETWEQKSASGGRHLIFTAPPDVSFPRELCRCVDIKHRGYILLAPSTFEGRPYLIEKDVPPAPVPNWVPRKDRQAPRPQATPPGMPGGARYGSSALHGEIARVVTAPEGTRNNTLNIAAMRLGQLVAGGELPEAEVRQHLTAAGVAVGLDAREVAATIDSGFKRGLSEPRRPAPRARHFASRLIRDARGWPIWNIHNAMTLLSEHPDWRGVLGHDSFLVRRVLLKPIPGQRRVGKYPRPLEDDDYSAAQAWFNSHGFPKAGAEISDKAVRKVCRQQTFDSLQDFLNRLVWDGTPRLAGWLARYCGATPSAYVSEVGMRWCISAVARGFAPGCKADHMLVLEGPQGVRKSSALAALAGAGRFSDGLPPMGTKDSQSFLRGQWIIEVAELEAMRREMDQIKAYISRQVERFRPAFGREEVDEPRRCVFAGTTNKDDWLHDETGGRRFWPVRVGEIDVPAIKRDREQLWAEAVALYRRGERWWLEGEIEAQARATAAERRADDPWRSDIARAVEGHPEVCAKQILARLRIPSQEMTPQHCKRVVQELQSLGWVRRGRVRAGECRGAARYVRG